MRDLGLNQWDHTHVLLRKPTRLQKLLGNAEIEAQRALYGTAFGQTTFD